MATATTAAAITTVQDLNAALGVRKSFAAWEGWTLTREYRLGRAGQQTSRYRGTAGAKCHLLDVTIVQAKPADEGGRKTFAVGAYAGIKGCVTGNGQFTGVVVEGINELDAVTCTRCKARLARILALVAEGGVR